MLFTFFGPSILEPDFHLSFWQSQVGGQFRFPTDRNVFVDECEFFFQLDTLMVGVDDAVFVFGSSFACNNKKKYIKNDQ